MMAARILPLLIIFGPPIVVGLILVGMLRVWNALPPVSDFERRQIANRPSNIVPLRRYRRPF